MEPHPKIRLAIKRMYTYFTVRLTFKKEVAEILQTVGVRRCDNLLPALFIFFMSVFSKSLQTKWRKRKISTAQFMRVLADELMERVNSPVTHSRVKRTIPTAPDQSSTYSRSYTLTMEHSSLPAKRT